MGIRYKYYVYLMYRKEMVKRLNEIMNSSSTDSNVGVEKLTSAEKRILITNAVGVIHEKLCKSNAFKHHFHATGTWLPINHLVFMMSLAM